MSSSRRDFVKHIGRASALMAAGSLSHVSEALAYGYSKRLGPNDKIRIATIGMGIQGFSDTRAALQVPGVELVAVCDLYNGRLERAREVYGNTIFTTRNYREILNRTDVDAVLIVTPDHWHDRITIDALLAGKAVYCEKPMVHKLEEGRAVIETQKRTGKVMQVGSQRISSPVFAEAKRVVEAGDIGQINLIEANNDRFNAIGAWQYSIPTDASTETLDWEAFLGDAPKRDFDATRFFRWRNYRDYGTGVAGDLFVHLITGIHYITGSLGPNRIYATGSLSMWKDGRDVPDVMLGILDYPQAGKFAAFQAMLKVNFANAGNAQNYTRIVGTEGEINLMGNSLVVKRNKLAKAPGFGGYDSYNTFSTAQQTEFAKQYNTRYSDEDRRAEPSKEFRFDKPANVDEQVLHFANFFDAIRNGTPNIEGAEFGFRAAAPVLACNKSYFEQKVILWDAQNMKTTNK